MKKLENTNKFKVLFLNGKNEESFLAFPSQKQKRRIGHYIAWYQNGEESGKALTASESTSDKFHILLNENQARAVIGFAGEEYSVDDRDVIEGKKKLQGVFIFLWKECDEISSIHFLWIDCRAKKICKSICLDTYGYKLDEVMGLFKNMFCFMSKGIAQIANEKMPSFEMIENDNLLNSENKSF